jgi:hypothetical protein
MADSSNKQVFEEEGKQGKDEETNSTTLSSKIGMDELALRSRTHKE